MFVEQRMYTAHPGKQATWLKLYETLAAPCSARHMGPLMGFFVTEFGPLNRAVFLRAFNDLADRDRGQAAREQDPEWQNFRAESAKLGALAQQENKLIAPVPWSPIQQAGQPFVRTLPGEGMVIDHRTYDFHPGKMNIWLDAYRDHGLPVQKKHLGQFVFMGTTEIGPINQVVFMWAYESLAARARRRAEMDKDPAWAEFRKITAPHAPLKQQTNMILKPTAFSPIR
jgi:NIPSNAP